MNLNAWEKQFDRLRRSAITPNGKAKSPSSQNSCVAVKGIRTLNEKLSEITEENRSLKESLAWSEEQRKNDEKQIVELQETLYMYQRRLSECNRIDVNSNRHIQEVTITNKKLNEQVLHKQLEIDKLQEEIFRLRRETENRYSFGGNRLKANHRYHDK